MISVIIPIYNVEKYLEKCLESVINQTYKKIEIILVNDGSTDESLNICKKYSKSDNRITIINQKNAGVSNARNAGIKKANGDYIIFIDPDDYININMLQILYDNINIADDVDISICAFEKVYFNQENDSIKKLGKDKKKILDKMTLLKEMTKRGGIQGFVWNRLYKKSIIDENKILFSRNIFVCEDFLFNSEYIDKINKGIYTQEKLYYYYQRKDSAYNGKFNIRWLSVIEAYEEIVKIYKKNNLYEYAGLKYIGLILNLDLKEKIIQSGRKIKINQINENINDFLGCVLSSNFIRLNEKIKIVIKAKFIRLFIILKNRGLKK